MQPDAVSRAQAAATALTRQLGLEVSNSTVVQNSNKLSLRLLPCDVLARVALADPEVAALEIELAQRLSAGSSPVAKLDPRVPAHVYEWDGFVITFWTYYDSSTVGRLSPADYAGVLHRLHTGMRAIRTATPHFTDRVAEAQELVANPEQTPDLTDADRRLLSATLHDSRRTVESIGASEQLLHGEPHPGNVLMTSYGPLFVDFETCCRGPIEFDLAHVPEKVCAHYPGIDQQLLDECRRLVLAMVAAWRWDASDELPNGRQAARDILAILRAGPPWPTLAIN